MIRSARIEDAAEMARLSGELGYPVTVEDMAQRLEAVLPDERHHIIVAAEGDRLLGRLHVERQVSIELGDRCELMGVVVDAGARRKGIGRALIDAAEEWARSQGVTSIVVRSNVARDQSHPFYESLGYVRSKTQHVYTRTLGTNPGAPGV